MTDLSQLLEKVRHVQSTLICGPHGPCVTRGHTDIGGIRFYDDQVVIGPHGEHTISRGYTALISKEKADG